MQRRSHTRASALKGPLPSQPFVYLIGVYLVAMVIFTVARGLFALHFQDEFSGVAVSEVVRAFLIGLRFDQIVVLYVLVPLALVLPWVSLRYRPVRWLTTTYLTVVFSVLFLLMMADIRFFAYYDSHLNFMTVDYMDEGPLAWNLVLSDPYLSRYLLFWGLLTIAFLLAVGSLSRASLSVTPRRTWVSQAVWFLLVAALMFLGIRGRTGLSPIDWGVAYHSENHFLNQLALNGTYTLGRAVLEEHHDPRLSYLPEERRFPFVPFADALDTVQVMLGQEGDEWLEPSQSLLRHTRQPQSDRGFQPNVVLVLLESWAAEHTGVLGSDRGLTPRFDSLAAQGILFTNFYASGIRTNYGLSAVLCSFPALPGRAVMKRYQARHPFRTLSEMLHDRGYFNVFAYGGDPAFDNMEGFFAEKGFDAFYGQGYFGDEHVFSKWGVPDHIMFREASVLIGGLPRPFMAALLTISNHEPFDLPDSSLRRYPDASDSSRIFNSQIYADHAAGLFMGIMKTMPLFDSTIFVFTADHARFGSGRYRGDPQDFHIPLLIYGPGIVGSQGRRVDIYGSQVDIVPTLMGLLGGDFVHASWGRNLLDVSGDDPGFAPMSVYDRLAAIDRDYLYLELLGHRTALYQTAILGPDAPDLKESRADAFLCRQRRLRAYTQTAELLSTPLPETAPGSLSQR